MNHQEFIPGFHPVRQFVLLGLCSHVQASDRIFLMVKHSMFPQVSSCAPKEKKMREPHDKATLQRTLLTVGRKPSYQTL